MKNSKLAMAIPTYNRADILKENLLYMMEDIKKYNIPIYISDDSSNNDTRKMIEELKQGYEYIYYQKNEPSLGHDKNCFATLQLPEADYVWYIGDSVVVKEGSIKKVLEILNNEDIDFLFINEKSRKLDKASGIYSDKNEILLEFGWHLTQTGATIYSKKSLSGIKNIDLCKVKNFPQFVLIFESLKNDSKVYWMNEKNISINRKKKSYWNEKVFEVFIRDWTNAVSYLSNYYPNDLLKKVIISHSIKTNLFSFVNFMSLRANNAFDKKILTKYKHDLKLHSKVPYILQYSISIVPIILLKIVKKLLKKKCR